MSCWERGRADAVSFSADDAEARKVRERLEKSHPWLVVTDVAAFEERWKANRVACEAEADAAAAAAKAAARVPPVPSMAPARTA